MNGPLGLPTTLDLLPIGIENDRVADQGKPHAANVICKNGTPLLIQVLKSKNFKAVCNLVMDFFIYEWNC